MQRVLTSRLSTRFLHLTSNLNIIKYDRNWNAGVEIKCIAQSCRNCTTASSGASNSDSDEIIKVQPHSRPMTFSKVPEDVQSVGRFSKGSTSIRSCQIGENVSKKQKLKFLVNTLSDLKDSREAVYSALDAWVAWEQKFPLVTIKKALRALEKDEQWHRVVQVIKWLLSKGQGTTMGTYEQLIRALDKDCRAEEAHEFWIKKIGHDLHSVPWQFCNLMISIYYRNSMLDRLIKFFKGLEAFDRKPPDKYVVQKVADAYEVSGLLDEKKRLLEKYNYLFNESQERKKKKSCKVSWKKKKKEEDGRTEAKKDQILESNLSSQWYRLCSCFSISRSS